VGPYLPQLFQSAKAMQQRAHDCIDHELHYAYAVILQQYLPYTPSSSHTYMVQCHAVPLPRASKLTLPSCSTALSSLLAYQVFHNQSQKFNSNALGSVKYLQPTTFWSQKHSFGHQFGRHNV